MRAKLDSNKNAKLKSNLPAPGTYDPNDELTHFKNPDYGMSKTKRYDPTEGKGQIPGPGNYTFYKNKLDEGPKYT